MDPLKQVLAVWESQQVSIGHGPLPRFNAENSLNYRPRDDQRSGCTEMTAIENTPGFRVEKPSQRLVFRIHQGQTSDFQLYQNAQRPIRHDSMRMTYLLARADQL
jgi:hypothetical protein